MDPMHPTLDMIDRIGEPRPPAPPPAPLRVGDLLGSGPASSHCGGYFGRDAYGTLRVEAIGADWVVARDEDGYPRVMMHYSPEELCRYRDPTVAGG